MAFSIGQISASVTANTAPFNASMAGVRKQGAAVASNVQRDFRGIGQVAQNVGTTLTKSLTIPIAAIGAASVKAFSTFDSEMTKSTAIMGNVSKEMRKQMEEAAMSVSEDLNMASSKAAESFFFLASAGLDAKQSVAALPQVAEFAKAGMFDMATATDLATDAQSALGLTVDDAAKNMENMARVTDVLVRANTLANASVQQFAESLTNRAAAALRSANKEIEEGVAVLSAFADQGMKGQMAGEQLARILRILSQEAAKNTELFKELGLIDTQGNLASMADIIEIITNEMEGLSDAAKSAKLEQLGFTARVQAAIKPLLGTADAIREYERELKNAGGTTEQIASNQMKSFSEQLGVTWQMVRNAGIEIGTMLAPAIGELNMLLRSAVSVWRGFSDTTKGTVLAIGGVAAAIGPLSFAIGGLLKSIPLLTKGFKALNATLLTNPWYAVGAAISFVGAKAVIAHGNLKQLHAETAKIIGQASDLDAVNRQIAALGKEYEKAAENAKEFPNLEAEDLIDPKSAKQLKKLIKLKEKLSAQAFVKEEVKRELEDVSQLIKFINTDFEELFGVVRENKGAVAKPFIEAKQSVDKILPALDQMQQGFKELSADQIMQGVDLNIGEKIFPPGSLGALQERLQSLREKLRFATDPAIIARLQNQIGITREEINNFSKDAEKAGNKSAMAMGSLGNAVGGVIGKLIRGKKEALSFGNILASIAPALINVLTGGAGGFASSLASGLFGGMFHNGGIVPGGQKERMVRVKPGEGIFTRGQMRAMGGMQSKQPQRIKVDISGEFVQHGSEMRATINESQHIDLS